MTHHPEQYKPETEQLWRANIYGLLATLLATPPDNATLKMLANIDRQSRDELDTPIENALHKLTEKAREMDGEVIREEYQTLFIGITRGEVVPYGSWYQTGFMMDKPLAELRSVLASLGYERREGVYESEDHVAALCDVMRGLITDTSEDLDTTLTKQRTIYNDHISTWITRFFKDLQAAEHASFYGTLAVLGETFMVLEKEYLKLDG